jgi:hypothetical protein
MTPRTMTEPEAWREIARRIVEGECRGYFMYTLPHSLYLTCSVRAATAMLMQSRVASHLGLATAPVPSTPDSRALAALWLALEAEEEGA